MKRILIFFVAASLVAGCSQGRVTKEKTSYTNINSDQLNQMLQNKDFFLLDVHIPEQKHIEKTDEFIPYTEIEKYKGRLPKDKDAKIVVYCRSGSMSATAAETLRNLGYTNVYNLVGGTFGWETKGYEFEKE